MNTETVMVRVFMRNRENTEFLTSQRECRQLVEEELGVTPRDNDGTLQFQLRSQLVSVTLDRVDWSEVFSLVSTGR